MPPIGGSDELTAEELAYLESGGKTELNIQPEPPSEPQNEPESGEGGGQGGDATVPAEGAGEPPTGQESPADDGDEGDDEVVIVGKDGKPRGKDGKFVSHAALHKERERHKLTKAERDDLKVKLARGEERLAILNEAFNGSLGKPGEGQQQVPGQPGQPGQQQQNPLAEPDIDPETDLFAAFKQMQRRTQYLQSQQSHFTQTQTARDTFAQITRTYHDDARRLMNEKPEFADAYRYLVESRERELEFMGWSDPVQRKQAISREESELVINAIKERKSPAEVIYNFAVARGFKAAPAPQPNGSGNPAPPPQKTLAQQKIEQVRAGQNAADTLSNAGGASHEGLTFAALANMSDDEFARAVDKMSKAELERFMGR